jgi:uncharacterized protein (TIGR00369 family)
VSELTSGIAACIERARRSGDYNPLLAALPYTRFLGFIAALRGDSILLSLPFRPELVGNPVLPAIHGGVVGACLESAALLQILHVRQAPPLPKTIDFSVDYLRAARACELFAEARVERLGRRVVNVSMRAFQGQEHEAVALGRGNFLVD